MFTTFLLVIVSLLFIRTFRIRITLTSDAFGPRTLPQLISGSIILWCVFQITRLFRLRSKDLSDLGEESAEVEGAQVAEILTMAEEVEDVVIPKRAFSSWLPEPPSKISKRLVVTVSLFLYVVSMQVVGFIASTYIFSVAGLWVFEEESPRVMIVLPMALSLGMYLLFENALHVRLP
jgi:Tripartite tricarboxylate transporter TctB family